MAKKENQRTDDGLRSFKQQQGKLGVDSKDCVIRGVSLITANVPCIGHQLSKEDPTPLWTDSITLKEMSAACSRLKKVPVRLDHGAGFKDQVGFIQDFSIEAGKLKGNLYLLRTHHETPAVMERAQRMPEAMGLSVSFVPGKDLKVPAENKAMARCADVVFCDLVSKPAANPAGLFSAKPSLPVEKGRKVNRRPTPGRHFTKSTIIHSMNGAKSTEEQLAEALAKLEKAEAALDEERQASQELIEEFGLDQSNNDDGSDDDGNDDDGLDDDGLDDDGSDDDGLDDGQGNGDGDGDAVGAGAGAGAAGGLAAELAEALGFIRDFKRQQQQRELQARKEAEARDLAIIAATVDEQEARIIQLEAENESLRALAAGVSRGGAASVTSGDRVRSMAAGEHEFAILMREYQEQNPGKSAALVFRDCRAANPELARDFSDKRRAGQI